MHVCDCGRSMEVLVHAFDPSKDMEFLYDRWKGIGVPVFV